MTQQMESVEVVVTGPPDQLAAFAEWCLTVQHLCSVGSSRTVEIDVDGDGSGALSFDFGDTDVSAIETRDTDDGSTVRTTGIGG